MDETDENARDFFAGIVGFLVTGAALLTAILAYLYVRDGFSTEVPILLVVSALVTVLGALLYWKVPRMRKHIPYFWI